MQMYVGNLFQNIEPDCFPYWKHSLPPALYSYPRISADEPVQSQPQGFPGVLFVCMVRSPYFWVGSSCRHPYDLSFHTRTKDLGTRLRSPVVLNGRQRFKNIMQVWNQYYHQYEAFLEPDNEVVYIRLEDLVRTPESVIKNLDLFLERKPRIELKHVIDKVTAVPTKPQNAYGEVWEEKNRMAYLSRSISHSDLAYISHQADQQLMQKYAYPLVWPSPEIC